MQIVKSSGWVIFGWLCLISPSWSQTVDGAKIRLFILSGQSNMVRLDPNVSFTPA